MLPVYRDTVWRTTRCRELCKVAISPSYSQSSGDRSPPASGPLRSRHIALLPAALPLGQCGPNAGSASRRCTASAKATGRFSTRRPRRSGTTTGAVGAAAGPTRSRSARHDGGPASGAMAARRRRWSRAVALDLGGAWPNMPRKAGHSVDIGGVRKNPEEHHRAAIRWWVSGLRLARLRLRPTRYMGTA